MKSSTLLLALTLVTTAASAKNLCSNVESMKISDKSMTLSISGKKSTLKLIHSVSDFAISKTGKWTVAYGGYFPKRRETGETESQTSIGISIFLTKNLQQPRKIIVLTQGVYEVMFDNEEETIYLSAQYGMIRVDGSTFKMKDLGMNPQLVETRQYSGRCESIHLRYPR